MKIERITPFLVDNCLLIRVYTDEGITGTGEAGYWSGHRLTAEAVTDLADYFVGKDPGRIEHHFQAVTRDTHFAGAALFAALSGIDVALWDILGKSVGKPVHQLLGGKCRDRARVFANANGATVAERVDAARVAVGNGFTSVRTMAFAPGWEQTVPTAYIGAVIETVAGIRETVGFDIDLGVELHRNFGPDESLALALELAPYRVLYYEDPTAPESIEAVRYVGRHVDIPIATGERFYSLHQFSELLATRSVAMIRPDLSLAGGFTQGRKIAALAEASFVGVFPHLMGSPVNLAAFSQFAAAIPNYALMECGTGALQDIVDYPPVVENGHVLISDRPGIGLDLREEMLAKYPFRPHHINPAFRADGSVAH